VPGRTTPADRRDLVPRTWSWARSCDQAHCHQATEKTQMVLPTPSELWKRSLHPKISSAKPFSSTRTCSRQHGRNAACAHHSDLDALPAPTTLPSHPAPCSSPPGRVTTPSPSQRNTSGRSRGGQETQRL